MAYIVNQNTEDEVNQNGAQPNGVPVGSQSGLIAPNTQAQGTEGNQTPSASGSFTNLQDYLGANQGEGKRLAGLATQGISDLENQSAAQSKEAQDTYNQQLQSAIPNYDSALVQNLAGGSQQAKDLTEEQKQAIINARTSQYNAPENIIANGSKASTLYQQARQNALDAAELAKNAGSETGRYNLLRQTVKSPTYSTGQTQLDQALLQLDPDARALLEKQPELANKSVSDIDKIRDDSANAYAKNQTDFQSSQKNLNDQLAAAEANRRAGISKQADDYNNSIADMRAQALNYQAPIDYSAFGLDPNQYVHAGGLKTNEQAATDDQRAELQALYGLMGKDGAALGQATPFDPTVFNPTAGLSDARNRFSQYAAASDPTNIYKNYINDNYNIDSWQRWGNQGDFSQPEDLSSLNAWLAGAQNWGNQGLDYGDSGLAQNATPRALEAISALQNDESARAKAGLPSLNKNLDNLKARFQSANDYGSYSSALQDLIGDIKGAKGAGYQKLKDSLAKAYNPQ